MNSFGSQSELKSGDHAYEIFRLDALASKGIKLGRLPYSLRILLENLLRHEDGKSVTADDIRFLANWDPKAEPSREIAYMPARVLMQDFTGVPAIVDLAAMRDAMKPLGGDPEKINPLQPAELVIDHSVQVDEFGTARAPTTSTPLSNSSATASATPSSSGARPPSATSPPCLPAWASATRSISNTSPASSSPPKSTASCRPIPTRSSAPTPTPP